LLSNGLLGAEQDDSGNLWLSSHKGLTRYTPEDQTFKNFFKEDGFLTNEFHYRGHFQNKSGQMIFGSSQGLVTFHPDSIKDSDYLPPIVFTDFKISNKQVKPDKHSPLKKHISVSDTIILNHDQNDLSISFASLDFSHPQRNEYTFYLHNLEDSWRPASRDHTAYYTNLDPGEYVFKVKGTNSDGVWNEKGAALTIIVLPPWWATNWAYILYGILIIGSLYSVRRYELNRQEFKHNWQLQQLEAEKLQEIDRMKSRFFANISHEFRTPLTLIKGPIQQLLAGDFNGNIKKQYQLILRNTNRLLQLINQLLDLSKLDSGKMTFKASRQNIIPLLKGLTLSFESPARQRNIELNFAVGDEEIELYIDQDKFEKIIINLLSNAFKFTSEGGEVGVKVKYPPKSPLDRGDLKHSPFKTVDRGGYLPISISNTGAGIESDQLEKIFDRFYQADDSMHRRQEGSGIGLALTKELVELHHGTISVESTPGRGSTFTVFLPLGNSHLSSEELVSDKNIADPIKNIIPDQIETENTTSKKLIPTVGDVPKCLIVEDNSDMRNYIYSCLEECYKIIQAENGEEGFQQALKHAPDIIISDVMMPGMDGIQFCSKIKTDERTSHIPVILLTAKASGESKIEGLETGADEYLTKPFDKRELLVRLKNLTEQRQKLREKFRRDTYIQPGEITAISIDEQLLRKAIDVVEENINNPDFDTTVFAREVGMSRMLLNTKIKALTGQTSGEFIRSLRLKRAARLLQQNAGNVSEIAYEVGFQNLSYFTKTFREQFGTTPSHYIND